MLKNEQQMSVHLANALGRLKKDILILASLAQGQVNTALRSLVDRDVKLARETIERDQELDKLEVELEEECLRVLALYQPVAHDLRFVVSALKLTNDLERIGDYGVHISERAISLAEGEDLLAILDLESMGQQVLAMLRKGIDCLINQDAELARQVWELDRDIDQLHRNSFAKIEAQTKKTPQQVGTLLQLLSVSRYLERIADLARNIADDVVYLVEGKLLRHRHSASNPKAAPGS